MVMMVEVFVLLLRVVGDDLLQWTDAQRWRYDDDATWMHCSDWMMQV